MTQVSRSSSPAHSPNTRNCSGYTETPWMFSTPAHFIAGTLESSDCTSATYEVALKTMPSSEFSVSSHPAARSTW